MERKPDSGLENQKFCHDGPLKFFNINTFPEKKLSQMLGNYTGLFRN